MKHFFQSFLGTVVAVVVLLLLAVAVGSCVVDKKPKIESDSWLIVEMNGDLLEYSPPGGLISEITSGDVETLTRILGNLEKAAVDDRVQGVIFKVSFDAGVGVGTVDRARRDRPCRWHGQGTPARGRRRCDRLRPAGVAALAGHRRAARGRLNGPRAVDRSGDTLIA